MPPDVGTNRRLPTPDAAERYPIEDVERIGNRGSLNNRSESQPT